MTPQAKRGDIRYFETGAGASIFQLPLEAFPGFWVHAYLVMTGDFRILIDAGSGLGTSPDDLNAGLESVSAATSGRFDPGGLTHILVTHGHLDHFGGLLQLASESKARIGIHGLDRRTVANFEERIVVTCRRLQRYFVEAGVNSELADRLLAMYLLPKSAVHSVRVDFTFEQVGMQVGPIRVLHTPGHCAGQVVMRLGNVLFSSDHVLSSITPHQAPEQLTLNTGLRHYLQSLETTGRWAGDVNLILGGHGEPFFDLRTRLAEIRESHRQRLIAILELLQDPSTTAAVSERLFGETSGYNTLLALEETGAHIEYLYQHGLLRLANLLEVERQNDPVPLMYQVLEPGEAADRLEYLLGAPTGNDSGLSAGQKGEKLHV